MRGARADGGQRLPAAKVAVHLEHLLALLLRQEHVDRQVLKVALQGACSSKQSEGIRSAAGASGKRCCEPSGKVLPQAALLLAWRLRTECYSCATAAAAAAAERHSMPKPLPLAAGRRQAHGGGGSTAAASPARRDVLRRPATPRANAQLPGAARCLPATLEPPGHHCSWHTSGAQAGLLCSSCNVAAPGGPAGWPSAAHAAWLRPAPLSGAPPLTARALHAHFPRLHDDLHPVRDDQGAVRQKLLHPVPAARRLTSERACPKLSKRPRKACKRVLESSAVHSLVPGVVPPGTRKRFRALLPTEIVCSDCKHQIALHGGRQACRHPPPPPPPCRHPATAEV